MIHLSGQDKRSPVRFGTRSLFICAAIVAMCAAGVSWFRRQVVLRRHYDESITQRLESLSAYKPESMTSGQWECAVGWTRSLHGNSLLRFQADTETLQAFDQRLAGKLKDPVDMTTIYWIWDEYAALCPGGKNYQRFRVAMEEDLKSSGYVP